MMTKPILSADYLRFRTELERRLAADGNAPLALLADGPLSRAELLSESDRVLNRWDALGLKPGDRIAIFCSDDRRLIILVLSALRGGLPFVVGDPKATRDEAITVIEVCRPVAVLADGSALGATSLAQPISGSEGSRTQILRDKDLVEVAAGAPLKERPLPSPDAAMLIFTSGTTSVAKAVELTWANLGAQLAIFAQTYDWERGSRLLNLLPLHHTDGLIRGPIVAAWFGATLCRPITFSVLAVPAILDWAASAQITHLVTVPAMLRILETLGRERRDAFRHPAFRFILCSADMLDASLWRRAEETFGVPVVNAYGLSEVVCDALFAGPDDATRVPGTIGLPVGVEVRIVDAQGEPVPSGEAGELVLAGPTVMRGYFGAPAATAAVLRKGAFHTGDLVRRRPDGLFEFVGRLKTTVVSGGVTIYPEGVTAVLQSLPGVAEAYAFGVPDTDRGERLVAAVVLMQGEKLDVTAVWDLCREHLPPERMPSEIRLLDRLPRTESGKVVVALLVSPADVPPSPAVPSPGSSPNVYAVAARCLRLPESALSRTSTPFNTPGWDSLAHMTIITEIEEAFGILFSAQDIMDFTSLGDAQAIVNRLCISE